MKNLLLLFQLLQIIAEGKDYYIGKQDPLCGPRDCNFSKVQPPSHGLYLLGTVEKDGVNINIEACGTTEMNCTNQTTLNVYLLRSDTKTLKIIKIKLVPKKYGCNHYTGSNSDKNPKAGDLVAVYIQKNQFKNQKQCPLQVNMLQNIRNNQYKFYEGSSFNETTICEQDMCIKKKIRQLLKKSPQLSDVNGTVEFNIRMKIKTSSAVPIKIIVGVLFLSVLLVIVLLLLVLLCRKTRRPLFTGESAETNETEFNDVQYLLQKDKDPNHKSRTVVNVYHYHYSKESSAKPNHEYSVLTEEYSPALNSPAASATPSAAAMAAHEHDYDEPYFEPACKEDELLLQLQRLGVPLLSRKALKILPVEPLGNGAFGTVYRGVWLHRGVGSEQLVEEEVAVKTLKSGANEEDRIKFLQEAAIMGQFDHPNIIKILGIVMEGTSQIPTEIMKNGDLYNHLHGIKESITDQELAPTLLSYSRQVANGMMYLAVKSFVHRDLAARNVLVSENRVCKIADFGFSRDLQNESYYVSHGGKIPVKWTAPEALHYRKYSTASDVWSYGCVLYEIWSLGVKPFHDLTNQEIIGTLSTGFRLSPPPGCQRDIYQVMIQCWNSDPSKRPSFMDLTTLLQKPDFQLLKWSSEELVSYSEEARTLGATLEAGHQLHKDLQTKYTFQPE